MKKEQFKGLVKEIIKEVIAEMDTEHDDEPSDADKPVDMTDIPSSHSRASTINTKRVGQGLRNLKATPLSPGASKTPFYKGPSKLDKIEDEPVKNTR
jgi:hypothetical protein